MSSEECSRITTELDEEFKRLIFPVFPDTSSGCTVSVLPWAPTRDIAMGEQWCACTTAGCSCVVRAVSVRGGRERVEGKRDGDVATHCIRVWATALTAHTHLNLRSPFHALPPALYHIPTTACLLLSPPHTPQPDHPFVSHPPTTPSTSQPLDPEHGRQRTWHRTVAMYYTETVPFGSTWIFKIGFSSHWYVGVLGLTQVLV